ncbi:MAG: four helix bundle protein [Vicinamibacteria bacterium]|nr:four helix bundle protein [Vicinamibacteria bacterium]
MAQANPYPGKSGTSLDRLDCYRLARVFYGLAVNLAPHGSGLGDQLRRAAASTVLNLAEGASRPSLREQARFTAIARGSALEGMAVLDLLSVDTRSPKVLAEARTIPPFSVERCQSVPTAARLRYPRPSAASVVGRATGVKPL